MGLFEKLFEKKTDAPSVREGIHTHVAPMTVCAPFTGNVIPLEKIPDEVFSQGILGPGCGIEPAEETVYAPFDGTVVQTMDSKHGIGLESKDGVEILIHVGMDTVNMAGKGFSYFVKDGDEVKAGQALMSFSLSSIKEAGHPATTAIVITNSDNYTGIELLGDGQVTHGEALMKVNQ